MKIIFIFWCSGMFRNVPGCSGMFRNVPCSRFYRRPRGSVMNLRYLNYDGTLRVFKLYEPPSLEWWRDKAEKGDTARYVAGLYLNVGDCFFWRKKCNSNFWVGKEILLRHGPFETPSAVLPLDTWYWRLVSKPTMADVFQSLCENCSALVLNTAISHKMIIQ